MPAQTIRDINIDVEMILESCGYSRGPDGRRSVPNTQEAADAIARETQRVLGPWKAGDPKLRITATGAGAVWMHLMMFHACHGRCIEYTYASPNATIVVAKHGD